jgi:dihydrofolate reductase
MPAKHQKKSEPRNSRRKLIYGVGLSLDGYIARPDGAVDFLFMPKGYSMSAFFKRIDTAIMGRKTYEVAKKMGGPPPGFSMQTYVMSQTLPAGEREGMTFTKASPENLMKEIVRDPGKDIWLMGGGELARAFLAEDLVDELYLGVVPVLVGEGLPAFPASFPEKRFTLVSNNTYDRGLIELTYERAH